MVNAQHLIIIISNIERSIDGEIVGGPSFDDLRVQLQFYARVTGFTVVDGQ